MLGGKEALAWCIVLLVFAFIGLIFAWASKERFPQLARASAIGAVVLLVAFVVYTWWHLRDAARETHAPLARCLQVLLDDMKQSVQAGTTIEVSSNTSHASYNWAAILLLLFSVLWLQYGYKRLAKRIDPSGNAPTGVFDMLIMNPK